MTLTFIPGIEVYLNPTSEELLSLGGSLEDSMVRFILVHGSRRLYCFPASIPHDKAMIGLGLHYSDDVLTGVGKIERDRITVTGLPSLEVDAHCHPDSVMAILRLDWSWTEAYLKGLVEVLMPYEQLSVE
ncbi:MAG: hypothetical protein AB1646_11700 [Thermodesulfobacteriota bacterium]